MSKAFFTRSGNEVNWALEFARSGLEPIELITLSSHIREIITAQSTTTQSLTQHV